MVLCPMPYNYHNQVSQLNHNLYLDIHIIHQATLDMPCFIASFYFLCVASLDLGGLAGTDRRAVPARPRDGVRARGQRHRRRPHQERRGRRLRRQDPLPPLRHRHHLRKVKATLSIIKFTQVHNIYAQDNKLDLKLCKTLGLLDKALTKYLPKNV